MNEPTKYEMAVAQMLLENKHWVDEIDDQEKADQQEWEWQMKIDKIEQNCDIKGERDNGEEEE